MTEKIYLFYIFEVYLGESKQLWYVAYKKALTNR